MDTLITVIPNCMQIKKPKIHVTNKRVDAIATRNQSLRACIESKPLVSMCWICLDHLFTKVVSRLYRESGFSRFHLTLTLVLTISLCQHYDWGLAPRLIAELMKCGYVLQAGNAILGEFLWCWVNFLQILWECLNSFRKLIKELVMHKGSGGCKSLADSETASHVFQNPI